MNDDDVILGEYKRRLQEIEKIIEEWKNINLDDCYKRLKQTSGKLCLSDVNVGKYQKYFNNDFIKDDDKEYEKALKSFFITELNKKTNKLLTLIEVQYETLKKIDMYSDCKNTCKKNYINLIEIWEIWLVNQNLFDNTVKDQIDQLVKKLLTNEKLKKIIKKNIFKPELLENIIIQVCNCVASNKYKIRFVYIGQLLNMFIQFFPDTDNMIEGLTGIFNSINKHNKQEIFKRCYANKSYEKPLDAFYRRIGCYIIKQNTKYKVTKDNLDRFKNELKVEWYIIKQKQNNTYEVTKDNLDKFKKLLEVGWYIIKQNTTYKVTKTQLDKFKKLLNENKTLFYDKKIHTKEDPFPLIFDVFVSTINKKDDYDRYLTVNRLNIQFYNKFFQALYIKNVCDDETKKTIEIYLSKI